MEEKSDFISKSLINHIIDSEQNGDKKSLKNDSNFKEIAVSSSFVLIVVIIIIIISYKKKNNSYSDDQNETEMASDSLMPSHVSL